MANWRRFLAFSLTLLLAGALAARDDEKPLPGDDQGEPTSAGKVQPIINLGGHSGSIRGLAFGKDSTKLYTVGAPGEVHEWDVASGQHLRVWRFPTPCNRLAISPDGKFLAVSGIARPAEKPGTKEIPVWRVNLANGNAKSFAVPGSTFTHALAYSPDGKKLAVAAEKEVHVVRPVKGEILHTYTKAGAVRSLQFDPSSNRLLYSRYAPGKLAPLRIVDTKAQGEEKGGWVFAAGQESPHAAWSPDGKFIACLSGGKQPEVRIFAAQSPKNPDWTLTRDAMGKRIATQVEAGGTWTPIGVAYLGDTNDDLLTCWHYDGKLRLIRVNRDNKAAARIIPCNIGLQYADSGRIAVSPDGRYLAVSANPSYRVAVYDLKAQQELTWLNRAGEEEKRIGTAAPRPKTVGWFADGAGVAWGYKDNPPQMGLNLSTLQMARGAALGKVTAGSIPKGWSIDASKATAVLKRSGKKDVPINLKNAQAELARECKVEGSRRLLVVHDRQQKLAIVDPETGQAIDNVGDRFFPVLDVAVSPDSRYVAVASGDVVLQVYSLARPRVPLLNLLHHRGDWLAWTLEGYFAGSPGGERLFGWKVTTDSGQLAKFYPAEKFRKRLYQPDLFKKLLEVGSVAKVLKAAAAATVDDLLPPRFTSFKIEQDPKDKKKFTITATAVPGSPKQPIEAMRLMLDGKLFGKEATLTRSADGKATQARWDVPAMPEGEFELSVLARSPDVNGQSEAKAIRVPAAAENLPTLHLLVIGLDYKDDKNLTLNCAVNDATAIFTEFPKLCAGPTHHFQKVGYTKRLLEKEATKENVEKELAELRARAKRQDLVVIYYAGHGERAGGEFYLLTHGANPNNLAKTALSGAQLRKGLSEIPGRVMLVLDACHSGQAGRALRGASPIADDAARALTDAECAVTLLAAAMAHEKAGEAGKHGYFTEAFLGVLKNTKDVTFDKRSGQQYINHLAVDVQDEVRHRSKEMQHPYLSPPESVEPFPVRRVRPPLPPAKP